jgi:asparaginyl-tRNA synthetase
VEKKNALSVRDILAGRAPQGEAVVVRGWIRTRRDSKAGFSFLSVSDGSTFHPVQVVAANALTNYSDEILKLTAGCAVEASGTIVPSRIPTTIRSSPSRTRSSSCARWRTCARAPT